MLALLAQAGWLHDWLYIHVNLSLFAGETELTYILLLLHWRRVEFIPYSSPNEVSLVIYVAEL